MFADVAGFHLAGRGAPVYFVETMFWVVGEDVPEEDGFTGVETPEDVECIEFVDRGSAIICGEFFLDGRQCTLRVNPIASELVDIDALYSTYLSDEDLIWIAPESDGFTVFLDEVGECFVFREECEDFSFRSAWLAGFPMVEIEEIGDRVRFAGEIVSLLGMFEGVFEIESICLATFEVYARSHVCFGIFGIDAESFHEDGLAHGTQVSITPWLESDTCEDILEDRKRENDSGTCGDALLGSEHDAHGFFGDGTCGNGFGTFGFSGDIDVGLELVGGWIDRSTTEHAGFYDIAVADRRFGFEFCCGD